LNKIIINCQVPVARSRDNNNPPPQQEANSHNEAKRLAVNVVVVVLFTLQHLGNFLSEITAITLKDNSIAFNNRRNIAIGVNVKRTFPSNTMFITVFQLTLLEVMKTYIG